MGRQHAHVQQLHDQYGPVVRIGPNHVSFTDASAINAIYGHRVGALAKVPETRKADFVHAVFGFMGNGIEILHAAGEDHQRLRRALSHGFSDKGLREQQPLIHGYVDLMMQQLRRRCARRRRDGDDDDEATGEREVVDMELWVRLATNDIVGDLSMGQSLKMLEKGELHPWAANTG